MTRDEEFTGSGPVGRLLPRRLAGAVVGAELVLNVGTIVPLAVATGLVAIVAAGAAVAARHEGEWRQAPAAVR